MSLQDKKGRADKGNASAAVGFCAKECKIRKGRADMGKSGFIRGLQHGSSIY